MYTCRLRSRICIMHTSWNRSSYKTRRFWTCRVLLDNQGHLPQIKSVRSPEPLLVCAAWAHFCAVLFLVQLDQLSPQTSYIVVMNEQNTLGPKLIGSQPFIVPIPQANNILPLISRVLLRCSTVTHQALLCTWMITGQTDHPPVSGTYFKTVFGFLNHVVA